MARKEGNNNMVLHQPTAKVLVEDEMMLRMRAVDILEDAGFTPIEAVNADDAFAILESRSDIRLIGRECVREEEVSAGDFSATLLQCSKASGRAVGRVTLAQRSFAKVKMRPAIPLSDPILSSEVSCQLKPLRPSGWPNICR
jgi:hypothetical protein